MPARVMSIPRRSPRVAMPTKYNQAYTGPTASESPRGPRSCPGAQRRAVTPRLRVGQLEPLPLPNPFLLRNLARVVCRLCFRQHRRQAPAPAASPNPWSFPEGGMRTPAEKQTCSAARIRSNQKAGVTRARARGRGLEAPTPSSENSARKPTANTRLLQAQTGVHVANFMHLT